MTRRRRGSSFRVTLPDLTGAGLLCPDEILTWERPRLGASYTCTVTPDGRLQIPDGRLFSSPSGAAMAAADISSYDGWYAWRSARSGGRTLTELREQFLAADQSASAAPISAPDGAEPAPAGP